MILLASLIAQIAVDHTCVDEKDSRIPRQFLDKARSLKILFGHQSVGGNLLEGLDELSEAEPKRYALERGSEPEAGWFDSHAGLGDFEVGENENPRGKIDHFQRKLARDGYGKRVQVAMMKLCYVDFGEDTDAKSLFERARDVLTPLEKDVRIVWWTAPLADADNRTRHAYNRLVREHCKAKERILFDLADIESHDPQGREHLQDGVPALWPKYTEDGGHLNGLGRARAARAFWWLLARLAGWDGK
jgi:hypothetical protein